MSSVNSRQEPTRTVQASGTTNRNLLAIPAHTKGIMLNNSFRAFLPAGRAGCSHSYFAISCLFVSLPVCHSLGRTGNESTADRLHVLVSWFVASLLQKEVKQCQYDQQSTVEALHKCKRAPENGAANYEPEIAINTVLCVLHV